MNPDFKSNREKFDWAILKLNVIVEVHGEQHYGPVCFGGIDEEEAEEKFRKQQKVDAEKEKAARDAGWAYVVVSYEEKDITEEELLEKIRQALAEVVVTRSIEELMEITRKAAKNKAKLKNRGFPKGAKIKIKGGKAKWPKMKIPSRPFPKKSSKE